MSKVRIGAIDENLVNKTRRYKELTGTTTVELVEKLLSEFFKEIKLTNDYINIDEIYYFNFKKLLKDGEVKATKNKLSQDLKETYIVKKIPNNLDKFDKNNNTFCYNEIPEKHLGIYSYNLFKSKSKFKDTELFQYYILFEYNEVTEELNLKLIDIKDIALLVDINDISDILKDLNEFNKIFIDELDRIKGMPESEKLLHDFGKPLFEFDNPLVYIGSTTVIESYINAKKIAVDVYSTNAEMYDELKGRFNSEDLIIFRDGKLVNPTDAENFKIKDNETSNTNLHL